MVYQSMRQSGFVAGRRVVAIWIRWSGDGGGGTAVGMISCGPSPTSVSSYEGFNVFAKLSTTHKWAKDVFLFLLVSFNGKLKVLN